MKNPSPNFVFKKGARLRDSYEKRKRKTKKKSMITLMHSRYRPLTP